MTGSRRPLAVVAALLLVVGAVGPAVAAGGAGAAAGAGTDAHASVGAPANVESGAVFQADAPTCSFPISRTDATGENVTVSEEPERVVALGANIAQIVWAVGAEEKIVGMPVRPSTAYLNGSENRTGIYREGEPAVSVETVVSLNPDLVLAPNIIPNETVTQLRDAGLTVYRSPFGRSLADVYNEINQTGRFLGACEAANATVATVQGRVNAIETAVADENRPSILYGTGFVAGNGTFVSAIMETAGAENVVANVTPPDRPYFEVSDEVLVNRTVEWLVVTNASNVPTGGAIANTTAVRENQTIVVNPNYINQPGPLVVRPMTEIARELHPEAMESANLSNISVFAAPGNATNGTDTTAEPNATDTPETAVTTDTEAIVTEGTTTTEATTSTTGVTTTEEATTTTTEATTVVETDTATATATDAEQAVETDTATQTTSGNGPGFGLAAAALALVGAGLLASRRRL